VSMFRSQTQKHKFSTTCPDAFVVESAPVPPEQEKWCVAVLRPGRTAMHYMTCRFNRMQKHNFGVMFPSMFFDESVPVPPKHEK
jgi:hypothetical protein